jgi:hypothetical protein
MGKPSARRSVGKRLPVADVRGAAFQRQGTHAQKQRLRDLLHEHSTAAVANPFENGGAYAEGVGLTVSQIELDAEPTATAVELPELELEVRQVSQRLAELPANAAGPARHLLDAAHRENLQHQTKRRQQFDEELTRGALPRGTDFSRFLSSLSHYFVRLGPPASEAEIEVMQTLSPIRFSDSLSEFYRSLGGLSWDFGDTGVGLRLFSPRTLLEAQQSALRWQRLERLSLIDMARWCWGNDRPGLGQHELPAAVALAAQHTLCVGWLYEGSCEQHAYVLQTADAQFQLHLWHQDEPFRAPAAARHRTVDLWRLLEALLLLREEADALDDLDAWIEALDRPAR